MAWTATVVLDDDKTDVGTAICVWNKGLSDEFVFSMRAQINLAGKNAVVAAAKAALTAYQAKVSGQTGYSATLTSALNS